MSEQYELTILMPCLNEAETLAICIRKAKKFLAESGVNGEIVVADNGSTDGSQQIAEQEGARVVHVPEKGYGAALIGGCNGALGKYIIMGDADDSYDFLHLSPFVEKLREGIWVAIKLGGPTLVLSMLVGVLIAIFQAVTQIHEQTISFILKLTVVILVLLVGGGWMMENLLDYSRRLFELIAMQ